MKIEVSINGHAPNCVCDKCGEGSFTTYSTIFNNTISGSTTDSGKRLIIFQGS